MQLQPLIQRWNAEGVRLLPPELPAEVEATFERLGFMAPRDVVEMFSIFGGMAEGDVDNELLHVCGLREMESENTLRSEFGPIFADYSISCWCFRLRPLDEETTAVYIDCFDERPPERAASSLTDFFAVYERDSTVLLPR
jgi:hypothetical protein